MPVPTYDKFIFPLLKVLAEKPAGLKSREAYSAVALDMGLSEDDCSELLSSGRQTVYQNRDGKTMLVDLRFRDSSAH